jgi:hypothetical protein
MSACQDILGLLQCINMHTDQLLLATLFMSYQLRPLRIRKIAPRHDRDVSHLDDRDGGVWQSHPSDFRCNAYV